MPKATMDKNDDMVFRQDDIWIARQITSMEPEAKSMCV